MLVWMLVASEEATSGSVMAKAERISPLSRGSSQSLRCCSVANICSTSMLPVSGALQLNTSDDQGTRPMISASGAYSRLLSRVPGSSSRKPGRNRFHRPSDFARLLRSSINDTGYCPPCTSSRHWPIRGMMWSCMKLSTSGAQLLGFVAVGEVHGRRPCLSLSLAGDAPSFGQGAP